MSKAFFDYIFELKRKKAEAEKAETLNSSSDKK